MSASTATVIATQSTDACLAAPSQIHMRPTAEKRWLLAKSSIARAPA
jgi:hypothetical protein